MDAKLVDLFDRFAIWGQRRGWLNLVELRLHLQVLLLIALVAQELFDRDYGVAQKAAWIALFALIFGSPCWQRWRVWQTYRDYAVVQRHQQHLNSMSVRLRESHRFLRIVFVAFALAELFASVGNYVLVSGKLTSVIIVVMVWVPWLSVEYFDCSTHVGPGHRQREISRELARQES